MGRIEIDGNDGVGKTTLVKRLRSEYPDADISDRGRMTEATDNPDVGPEGNVTYLLLDVPVEVSRRRLAKAGKDLDEKYHTVDDLTHYRQRFLTVAKQFEAAIVDASDTPDEVYRDVLAELRCYRCFGTGEVFSHAAEDHVSCLLCGGTGIK